MGNFFARLGGGWELGRIYPRVIALQQLDSSVCVMNSTTVDDNQLCVVTRCWLECQAAGCYFR